MKDYLKCFLFTLTILSPILFPAFTQAQSHTTSIHIPVGNATIKLGKQANTETKKILVSDNLSSTKAIITESGELSDIPSYYPYGSSIQQAKISEAARQYTGQRKVSDDSPVYNYNARYYNPTTAIFDQPDSVEGPNRFAYVAGNPTMNNDPSGNECLAGFSQRCQGTLNQQLNLFESTPYYGANKEFPIEGVGFMANLMEFNPVVGAIAGAYEAITGKSFPEGDPISTTRRVIGGVAGGLGGAYAANMGAGALNTAIQTSRVERLGGKALLAAQNGEEAIQALRSLETGTDMVGVSTFKASFWDNPMYKESMSDLLTLSSEESRAIELLNGRIGGGIYHWRSSKNPNGAFAYTSHFDDGIETIKHEGVHMLQDFGGHSWGMGVNTRRTILDVENMAYTTTRPSLQGAGLLKQLSNVFGSVTYHYPGFNRMIKPLENVDKALSQFPKAYSIQGINAQNN